MPYGGFINPVQGIITSSFGERVNPLSKKSEFHTGLDIAVPVGTEVVAVADGFVTEVGNTAAMGNYLRYITDNGFQVLYAHLQKANVKKGERIERGRVVALSGNTGRTTGPHLHYTMWVDDQLTDPFVYVQLPYSDEVKNELAAYLEK